MKQIANLFLPPILKKLGAKILPQSGLLSPFPLPTEAAEPSKVYATYEDAEKDCTKSAYQNNELCNLVAEKTLIANQKPYEINSTNVFLLAALNYIIAKRSLKSIVVLDFGGACGAHYFEIRRFLPESVKVKWMVVETPQMVTSALSHGLNNNELSFTENIGNISGDVDLVYSSGALQYVPLPIQYLHALLKVNAPFVLFNRMMFNENDGETIVVQQSWLADNGPGPLPPGYENKIMSYPHTTISWPLFNKTVLNSNYELEWDFTEKSGSLLNRDGIKSCGLFYSREQMEETAR